MRGLRRADGGLHRAEQKGMGAVPSMLRRTNQAGERGDRGSNKWRFAHLPALRRPNRLMLVLFVVVSIASATSVWRC